LSIAEQCEEPRLVGMLRQNLGVLSDIAGITGVALAHYRASLDTFEGSNDSQNICWVLSNLGCLHVKEHRFETARVAYDRALAITRELGDLFTEGLIEENRAEMELTLGDLDAARTPIDRALSIAEQRHDIVRRAAAMKLRGAHERLSGDADSAADTLSHALTLSAVGEDAMIGAEILYQFGNALADRGVEKSAREVWTTALEAFERIGAPDWVERAEKRLSNGSTGRYL
jgi:tetratricopeptide (TPR) repeat protein